LGCMFAHACACVACVWEGVWVCGGARERAVVWLVWAQPCVCTCVQTFVCVCVCVCVGVGAG